MPDVGAVVFDLNGTLSDDEEIYFEIYRELLAEHGRELERDEYYASLVGHADELIFRRELGLEGEPLERVLAERVARFRARTASGETVPESARAAVRAASRRVPVGIVTGAFRSEAEGLLAAAGLLGEVRFVVAAEDVARSKPDPEPYLVAVRRLGLAPGAVVAFEDTAVGIRSAKAAGLRVVGVAGTLPPERLFDADEVVAALDVSVVERVLHDGGAGSLPPLRTSH